MNKDTIEINGEEYVKKTDTKNTTKAPLVKGMDYVILRTYSAGVFAGYLEKREGQEATLLNARRLWYRDGAASLSQLAMEGVSKPENCKFPCEVDKIELLQVIEILQVTDKAFNSIKSVKIWEQ